MDINPDIEYEMLAQEMYKCLLSSEGFEDVNVKHNVKIEGKSGCRHQIDVYWEFRLGGEIHKVAIECKNYHREITVGRIRDFFGVLHDIGNIKGIMATKKGFQIGAKKFAEYYSISLKELRTPEDGDFINRVKAIEVDIAFLPRKVKHVQIEPDLEWLIQNKIIKSEAEKYSFSMSLKGRNDLMYLYDNSGNEITDFLDLENQLPHNGETGLNFTHRFEFTDAFVETTIGKVKISSVIYTYDITKSESVIVRLDAINLTKAILKDLQTGEKQFLMVNGAIK